MSLAYIRSRYGVPARRGQRVLYTGDAPHGQPGVEGRITSATYAYVNVLLDGHKRPLPYHPTWKLAYLSMG